MSDLTGATKDLVAELSRFGAGFRPPANGKWIHEVEHLLDSSFPDGIRDFYRHCDGIVEPLEKWWWDFFPLGEVVKNTLVKRSRPFLKLDDRGEIPYASLTCFCDVIIDAPAYLFVSNAGDARFGWFYADSNGNGWRVARSYEEFVRVFVAEHDEILLGLG